MNATAKIKQVAILVSLQECGGFLHITDHAGHPTLESHRPNSDLRYYHYAIIIIIVVIITIVVVGVIGVVVFVT